MAVAGAPIYVFGKLTVTGVCHGYYNHGQLHVFGDAKINLVLADDYAVTVTGKARGKLVNLGYLKARGFEKHAAPNVLAARYYQANGEPPAVEYSLKSDALYDALPIWHSSSTHRGLHGNLRFLSRCRLAKPSCNYAKSGNRLRPETAGTSLSPLRSAV